MDLHNCLTETDVLEAKNKKNLKKLEEVKKKANSCVSCKRIFLKVMAGE